MYKRILTIQDISCVGQCSITVALPILSACGIETCILPTAVLSTHTGGFKGFTFRDLCDDIPKITEHWKNENIMFDAVYTGYLGNSKHVDYVKDICDNLLVKGGKVIVDPAMADNGKLYTGFDDDYVESMKILCNNADIILPNLTEACFLADMPYPEVLTREFADELVVVLSERYNTEVVLTGVSFSNDETGVLTHSNGIKSYYKHKKIHENFHGTGDVYSSVFVSAYLQEKKLDEAVKTAADFTVKCIENTMPDASHRYGVKFEPELKHLSNKLF